MAGLSGSLAPGKLRPLLEALAWQPTGCEQQGAAPLPASSQVTRRVPWLDGFRSGLESGIYLLTLCTGV